MRNFCQAHTNFSAANISLQDLVTTHPEMGLNISPIKVKLSDVLMELTSYAISFVYLCPIIH
jgi:hypothetical protein